MPLVKAAYYIGLCAYGAGPENFCACTPDQSDECDDKLGEQMQLLIMILTFHSCPPLRKNMEVKVAQWRWRPTGTA